MHTPCISLGSKPDIPVNLIFALHTDECCATHRTQYLMNYF